MITLLHGFLGDPSDWKEITSHLNAPCQTLFLPGHGTEESWTSFESRFPEKSIIVGYSLGGRLALKFAARHPEQVKGLILLSTRPGLDKGRQERILSDEACAKLLETEGMERFLEKWYAQPLFSSFLLPPALLKKRLQLSPNRLAKVLRDYSPGRFPNYYLMLKNFSFPLVFLFGENDITYRRIGKQLQSDFPVHFIQGCSHAIHLENPLACAEIIQRSIDEFSSDERNRVETSW